MNWLMGFVMGILLAAGYNRIVDIREEAKRESGFKTAEIIEAIQGRVTRYFEAQPDRPRLESTCIQIWGMKQND
jgi:hypothetical protein